MQRATQNGLQGEDLVYQWFKDGTEIPGPGAKQSKLIIEAVAVSDSGRYEVTVSNSGGTAHSIKSCVHVKPPLGHALTSASLAAASRAGRQRRMRAAHRRGASLPAEVLDGVPLAGDASSGPMAVTGQRHSSAEATSTGVGTAELATPAPAAAAQPASPAERDAGDSRATTSGLAGMDESKDEANEAPSEVGQVAKSTPPGQSDGQAQREASGEVVG